MLVWEQNSEYDDRKAKSALYQVANDPSVILSDSWILGVGEVGDAAPLHLTSNRQWLSL